MSESVPEEYTSFFTSISDTSSLDSIFPLSVWITVTQGPVGPVQAIHAWLFPDLTTAGIVPAGNRDCSDHAVTALAVQPVLAAGTEHIPTVPLENVRSTPVLKDAAAVTVPEKVIFSIMVPNGEILSASDFVLDGPAMKARILPSFSSCRERSDDKIAVPIFHLQIPLRP